MSVQDVIQILTVILLIVLIVSLAVIAFKIVQNLGTLHLILKDTNNVSSKISDFSDNPERFRTEIQEFATLTIDTIAEKQAERMRSFLANRVLGNVVRALRSH